jgi:hypothetical protein
MFAFLSIDIKRDLIGFVDFGSFHSRVDNVINDSFNYTVTRQRWNCQELLKKYIIFRSALIHVLAHFRYTFHLHPVFIE